MSNEPERTLVEKAEALLACLRDTSSHEDAFRWCLEIVQDLHSHSLSQLSEIEYTLSKLIRR